MGKAGKRRGYRPRTKREQALAAAQAVEQAAAQRRYAQRRRVVLAVCAVLLAALLLLGIALLLHRCTATTALATPHCQIDRAMLSYYFYDHYITEMETNAAVYLAQGLDPEKPLDLQMYDKETTWEAHWMSALMPSLRQMLVFAEAAYQEGSADQDALACRAAADTRISLLQQEANLRGMALSSYLAARYGQGVDADTVRRAVMLSSLAEYSSARFMAEIYTEQERMALYQQEPAAFHAANLIAYEVKVDLTGLRGEEEIRAAYLAAEARANAIAAAGDEAAFCAAIISDLQQIGAASSHTALASMLAQAYRYHVRNTAGDAVATWAHTAGRRQGERAVLGATGQYTVVYCLSAPDVVPYHRAAVQYIRIPYHDDLGAAAAQDEAQTLYHTFLAGEKSSSSFMALSEHATSALRVTYGDLPAPLCDWLMAKERAPGDCTLLSAFDGVYLLYYSAKEPLPLWQTWVADALREADYGRLLAQSGLQVYDSVCRVPSLVPNGLS